MCLYVCLCTVLMRALACVCVCVCARARVCVCVCTCAHIPTLPPAHPLHTQRHLGRDNVRLETCQEHRDTHKHWGRQCAHARALSLPSLPLSPSLSPPSPPTLPSLSLPLSRTLPPSHSLTLPGERQSGQEHADDTHAAHPRPLAPSPPSPRAGVAWVPPRPSSFPHLHLLLCSLSTTSRWPRRPASR